MTMMTTMAMTMIAAVGTMVVIVLLMVTAVGMVVWKGGMVMAAEEEGGGDARVASLLGAGIIPKPCRDWCVAGGLFERSAAGKANLRSTG